MNPNPKTNFQSRRKLILKLTLNLTLNLTPPFLAQSLDWSLPLVSLSVCVPSNPATRETHRQHKIRQDIRQQDRIRQTQHDKPSFSSRFSTSRFACPTSYEFLSQSSDDEDDSTSSVGPLLSLPDDHFSALTLPPPSRIGFHVSYDLSGLPVTSPAFRAASKTQPSSFLFHLSHPCSSRVLCLLSSLQPLSLQIRVVQFFSSNFLTFLLLLLSSLLILCHPSRSLSLMGQS